MSNSSRNFRLSHVAMATVIVCGSHMLWARSDAAFSQQPKATAPKGAPAAPAQAQNAVSVPQRTESIVYDSWTVTCQDPTTRDGKRMCSAVLVLDYVKGNQRQLIGRWFVAKNNEGALVTALQTPMFQTKSGSAGVSISRGVELTLGNTPVRKLSYAACEPQRCEATIPMDAQMVKDALASSNASIGVFGKDGTKLTIDVPSIKGIDKAVSAVSR